MTETKKLDLNNPTVLNHYFRFITNTEPTTGVGNISDIGYLFESVHNNGIDPDLEEYAEEHPDEEIDEWDSTTIYYGFIKAEDGKYDFDPDKPFSVIWSDWAGGTYQILKSPYVQFCQECSPCCPGQVSLGRPGKYMGYSPSLEHFDEDDTDIPEVWIYDLEYEIKRMHQVLEIFKQRTFYAEVTTLFIESVQTYLGALSTALAENQKNPEQRILVKQQRIE